MKQHVLWLCSWYPNDTDLFIGDFIQRQAQAVSLFSHVDVFSVVDANTNYSTSKSFPQMTEQVMYIQASNKFTKWLKYIKVHQTFIKQYIQQNGKPEIIHVQVPVKAGLIALYWRWKYKIPFVVTEHYGIYNDSIEDNYRTQSFLFRYITKLVFKYASVLTTVSHSLGKEINDWVIKKPFEVIPNVVDTSLFFFKPILPETKFQFLHISNMMPLKNIQGIMEASEMLYQQRQDFEVHFIGNSTNEYENFAHQKGLLNTLIFFEGILSYVKVAERIKANHCMIIFSDSESQSCVVLESLCCGRPAIVTQVGGVQELIDQHNGYTVAPKDIIDLANKMNEMINNYNSFDLPKIAEDAKNNYAYDAVGKSFVQVYNSLSNHTSKK